MGRNTQIFCLLLIIATQLVGCGSPREAENTKADYQENGTRADQRSELEQLLIDVFAPQAGENVMLLVDLPNEEINDNQAWNDRRQMAELWQAAFQNLGKIMDFSVSPMATYLATGRHNGPLPEEGQQDGKTVQLAQVLASSNIVVAMTEFSATAPLKGYTERFPELRVASMPGVGQSMMTSALSADYRQMAEKCHILADRLNKAEGAHLTFSTGQELYIDLRFRQAKVDDGQLHGDKEGLRVINLPSGEAFIAPYEGENTGIPSRTQGQIPIPTAGGEFITLTIKDNLIGAIEGKNEIAQETKDFFDVDPARRNLAELGLGCNDKARVSGNVLEDEKVMGVHLAAGLSEHIGGVVGVEAFQDPANALHEDRVYPFGGDIEVTTMTLDYEDGTSETIIQDSQYTLFKAD